MSNLWPVASLTLAAGLTIVLVGLLTLRFVHNQESRAAGGLARDPVGYEELRRIEVLIEGNARLAKSLAADDAARHRVTIEHLDALREEIRALRVGNLERAPDESRVRTMAKPSTAEGLERVASSPTSPVKGITEMGREVFENLKTLSIPSQASSAGYEVRSLRFLEERRPNDLLPGKLYFQEVEGLGELFVISPPAADEGLGFPQPNVSPTRATRQIFTLFGDVDQLVAGSVDKIQPIKMRKEAPYWVRA